MMMKQYIEKCLAGEDLSVSEASQALELIMTNQATEAQIAGLLVVLRAKGESVSELVGFARTMREKSVRVHVDDPNAIDMVGTGGDGLGTFNISTVASFVAAGGGATVAKHGNRSVSSRSGSADMLSALGVNIQLEPQRVESCINAIGVGFLFAPLFHPAMKAVAKLRTELGVRTIFNMVGPITNPASVKRQLIGTFHRHLAGKLAGALQQLQTSFACLVHSDDGMDEVALSSNTSVLELDEGGMIRSYSVSPGELGFDLQPLSGIRGGEKEANAEIALRVLNREPGPSRDIVIANAAFGLYVSGKAKTIQEGKAMAAESINSGRALSKLNELIEYTNRP